ncbi:unnamed protein product [Chilo suppressalis]|uniref:Major facilitator superfamily (MFS) profile domain-containing protein n=1 Tax=Chilo suppressalis TaxID=168631 RepID=A0ABN8B470_CHISP|nr:unnamed protein product [Chilo suppressalis]
MVQKLEVVKPNVSRLRSVLSQVIACLSLNVMLLGLALAVGFPTILTPELLNSNNELSLTDSQASWLGSMGFLTQPFGAVLSGSLIDYFGRKKSTFMVNFPHIVAWILVYFSSSVPMLFIANGLLGFGTGLMEAPLNAYIGEITEPSIRGILSSSTQLYYSGGTLLIYFLGKIITWREAALVSLGAPIVTMMLIIWVPETPVWLLSQGREKEALKSLCFLRGWTKPENVREEFDQLTIYCKQLQRCVICCKTEDDRIFDCEHTKVNFIKRIYLKFRYVLMAKETLRPFTMLMMYFMFVCMTGLGPIRPNMINICGAFGMAYDGKNIAVMVGIISFVTSGLLVLLIRILGKRKLGISSMFSTGLMCMALSIYAGNNLEASVFSFDISTFPKESSYIPLVLLYVLTFCAGFATSMPWILLGEVFPFRSRAFAQGVLAASAYVFMFIGSKTFLNFERGLKLSGAFAIYAAFGYAGAFYLYFFLPETEGKTLQEIEPYFSGKFKTFADDPFINFFKLLKIK